uniref:RING-type E3 ubiquitin transferase n=1 Tax=Kalanchoe fedtschenkoi TaxID=63787 RepID=A0A7N0V1V6_KALFE
MAYRVTTKLEPKWTSGTALCSSFCNAATNDSGFCPAPCLSICPATCQFVLIPPAKTTAATTSSAYTLDPFFLATFACLAVGFLVMCSYAIYLKYYVERRSDPGPGRESQLFSQVRGESNGLGLQGSVIRAITVEKYRNGDDLFREKECAVCLSEFQDGEALRILPKCNHAFHMSCVDVWLGSHISCPMCRACIMSSITAITPATEHHNSPV